MSKYHIEMLNVDIAAEIGWTSAVDRVALIANCLALAIVESSSCQWC